MATRTKEANAATPEDFEPIDASHAPATINAGMELGKFEGDISMDGGRLPRLQMAYGVGKLSEDFKPGDLVFGGDTLLASKGEPVRFILLYCKKYWKQYLTPEQFKAGIMPAAYNDEAEVLAVGGVTKWVNGVGPSYKRALHMKMLIEKPEGVTCGMFGIELKDGEKTRVFAPAVFDVDKTAYTRIGPVIESTLQFALRQTGMMSGLFQIETKTENKGDGPRPLPSVKYVGVNSEEIVGQIKTLFSANIAGEEAPF